jgi:hypothetical protein
VDVCLDANTLLTHVGLAGVQFAELCVYLRAGNSALVIPQIAVDECLEKYRQELLNRINGARSSWHEVRRYCIDAPADHEHVDVDAQVEKFRARIHEPAPGVKSIIYANTSGVDVNEIVRRGIKRIKPASKSGEELRDVIIWLMALHYAKQTKRQVAFISNDGGFRSSKESDELDPVLQQEIGDKGVLIKFYRDLSKFLADNLPQKTKLDLKWFAQQLNMEDLKIEIGKRLVKMELRTGAVRTAQVVGLQFESGMAYSISQGNDYVELECNGTARVILTIPSISNYLSQGAPNLAQGYLGPTVGSAYSMPVGDPEGGWITIPASKMVPMSALLLQEFDRTYKVEFVVTISARVEAAAVRDWQIETLKISTFTEELIRE